ncbi:MAG: hypothetical protein Q9209_001414 [Squamulea sp. 1 TL-2023]
MHHLPPELQHLIFELVNYSDISNLRLVCRTFASVGLDHLLPEVELTFTRKSFDRVAEIARHPGLRHCVKSLIYYIDTLPPHSDQFGWFQLVRRVIWLQRSGYRLLPLRPAESASEREWRLYRRNYDKWMSLEWWYTKKQLAQGFAAYEKLWYQQDRLRTKDHARSQVIEIVTRLPNLRHITLSNFAEFSASNIVGRTFEDTLLEVSGDEHYHNHCGVPQLLSLLSAINVATADIKIDSLDIGIISWKILQESDQNLELVMEIFRTLKQLKMVLCTSQHYYRYNWQAMDDDIEDEQSVEDDRECQAFLDTGRHLKLLQATSRLQSLYLSIQSNRPHNFSLVSVFGNTHWPHLREIKLHCLCAVGGTLVDFLTRHAQTLRILHFQDFTLLQGLWIDVFQGMRTSLHLDKFITEGFLESDENEADYFDCTGCPDLRIAGRDRLEAYVLGDKSVTVEELRRLQRGQAEGAGLY